MYKMPDFQKLVGTIWMLYLEHVHFGLTPGSRESWKTLMSLCCTLANQHLQWNNAVQ